MLTKIFWRMLFFISLLSIKTFSTYYQELSSLEKNVVDEGLATFDLVPVENANGLIVGKIYIFTASPFSLNSGFLTILNHLHINSKEDVVQRELFQKEGELFDINAIRDSEMALRALKLVRSLAVIVPVKHRGSKKLGFVDLLVATQDLLSLKPTFNFEGSGVGKDFALTDLQVSLGEHNFLGYNRSISASYDLEQSTHIISAAYFDPLFFNSRLQFKIESGLVFAKDTFKYNGFIGKMILERPLISETDRFGYGINLAYGTRPIIDFNGKKIRIVEIPTTNGVKKVEKKYHWHYLKSSLFGRVSFGSTFKNELFTSYNLVIKHPSILKEFDLDQAQQEYFKKNILPKNELESFITLGYSYFENHFLKIYDYDNYKLQETIRTGPNLTISNDFASKKILLSDNNFLRPKLKAAITQPVFKDGFIYLGISATTRFDGEFSDNMFSYDIALATPKIYGFGRIISEGNLSLLYKSRDNKKFVLGADSGVRGVESRFYSGTKGFRTNLEFRSSPINIWIFYAGFAIFYDVGAAFNEWREANATHAVGFGFRILAPQISSTPFRIDLAFPVYGIGKNKHVMVPSFGTGQAF